MRKTYFVSLILGRFFSTLVSVRNRFSSGFKFFSLLLLVLLVSGESWGQVNLVNYSFDGSGLTGSSNVSAQSGINPVMTASVTPSYFQGNPSTGMAASFASSGSTKYLELTLSTVGYSNIKISFDGRSSSANSIWNVTGDPTGGTSFSAITSLTCGNGSFASLASTNLSATNNFDNKSSIKLRFVCGGTSATMRIDNIVITGLLLTPTTTSITPTSSTAGSGDFTLTVNGTNFISGLSNITWGGVARTTTFVSSTQLTTTISAADIASAGTATVGVTTTGASSNSNTQTFTINSASNPILVVTGTTAHGSTCPNSSTVKQTYTITNTGTEATNVVVSSNDTQFEVSNLSSTTIAATNGSVTYDVTFTPSSAGDKSATINVYYNTGTLATTSSLTGTGTATITQAVSTSTATLVTAKSATLNGDLTTLGVCPASIEKGFVYSVTSTNSNPLVYGTGVTKTSVASIASGAYTLALSNLLSSTGYSYKSYVYDGLTYTYGAVQTFTTSIALVISGTSDNGSPCINTAASPITYTITNNGAIAVEGIAVNTSDAQFVVSALSSTTIAADGTATYTLTFTPTTVGSKSSTITVSSTTIGIVSATNIPTGTGVNTAPIVSTTSPANSITATTVTLSGNVTNAGCQSITERGICYGETLNPDISGTKTTETGTTGIVSSSLTGLSPNTLYHFRAYATSSAGTSYGSDETFTTSGLSATTANAATSISSTGFTANWDVVTGASGYKFDVSSKSDFVSSTVNSNQNILSNSGSTGASGWTETSISQLGGGSPYLGLLTSSSTLITPAFDLTNFTSVGLNLKIRTYGGTSGSSNVLTVSISTNNGSNWTQLGTRNAGSSALTAITEFNLDSYKSSQVKVKFQSLNATGSIGIGIDDILIDGDETVYVPDLLSGYNDLTVSSGNSQSVTGLTPNTAYYYRVRATSTNSTSANSSTVTAITALTGSVNASTLPVCATCNLVVDNGGEFSNDGSADRTYNTITVAGGGKLTNPAGSTLRLSTLTLNSDGNGTGTYVDKGTSDIPSAIVNQNLASVRNWYISSPVSAADRSMLPAGTLWKYNELNNATPSGLGTALWEVMTSNEAIDAKKGYIFKPSSSGTISFSGTLNTGDQTITLNRTENGAAGRGYNLVGNPYPSYVNWMDAIDAANTGTSNLSTTMWYKSRNAGNPTGDPIVPPYYVFDTFNKTANQGTNNNGAGTVTGMIPPMQAFWVLVKSTGSTTTGTLKFTNAMRDHESGTNRMKAPSAINTDQKVLRLQVTNGINKDESILLFNQSANNGYDDFDSPKMLNGSTSTVPDIYTLVGAEKLVINGLKDIPYGTEIPLYFKANASTATSYTLVANEISNFEAGTVVYIKNNLTKQIQLISDGSAYAFEPSVVGSDPAFSLIIKAPGTVTDINGANSGKISIFANQQGQISVITPELIENGLISVYNAVGQKLLSRGITTNVTVLKETFVPGVYVVKVNDVSRKVIVK